MNTTTKQVLIDARQLLVEKGWIQGHYVGPNGFCASGAIKHVTGDNHIGLQPWQTFFDTINRNSMEKISIPIWNDQSTRTKEEVLAMFDKAIASVS